MKLEKPFKNLNMWDILLIISFMFFLLNGLYYVFYTGTTFDEGNFLYKSYLYASGIVKPYSSNSVWTEYMPGGYYLLGISQLIFGKSFYYARLLSFFFGVLNFFLCYSIAKKVSGNIGGVLTLVFIVTNIHMVRSFSNAYVYSFVSFFILLFIYSLISELKPSCKIVTSLILMFVTVFIRSSMLPSYLFISIYWLFIYRKNTQMTALVILSSILIPSIFLFPFMPGVSHIFLQLPIIRSIAVHYGYPSIYFYYLNSIDPVKMILPILEFIKYYKEWFIILFTILTVTVLSDKRKDYLNNFKKYLGNKYDVFVLIIILFIFNIVVHHIGAYGHCPRCIIGYFNYYSVLGAIILGVFSSFILKILSKRAAFELIFTASLLWVVYIGSATMYNISLTAFNDTSLQKIEKAAKEIKILTGKEDKIFLITEPHYLYLSERNTYGPLINYKYGFRFSKDSESLAEIGLWNVELGEKWLDESDWVLSDEDNLSSLKNQGEDVYRRLISKIDDRYFLFKTYEDAWPANINLYKKRVN